MQNNKIELKLSENLSKIPISNNSIRRILIDENNDFWVTLKDFSVQFIPNNFDKIIDYNLFDFTKDANALIRSSTLFENKIYFITFDNNFFCFDTVSQKYLSLQKHTPYIVQRVFSDANGVYLNSSEGIEEYKKNANGTLAFKGFKTLPNRTATTSQTGLLSVNTNVVYENNKALFVSNTKMRLNKLYATNSSILVANEEKIFNYSIETKKITETALVRPCNVILNHKNNHLVGTLNGEIYLLNNNLEILSKYKLSNAKISNLYFDAYTNLFYVSNDENLHLFRLKNDKLELIKSITSSDGLNLSEINSINANKEQIILTTKQGVTVIDKKQVTLILPKRIDVDIDYIKVNNKLINHSTKTLLLDRKQNNIVFKTSIHSFRNEISKTKKYISFSKNGEKHEWKEVNEEIFSFYDLPHGAFQFSILIKDGKGHELIKTMSFKIAPYLWERTIFKIVSILVAMALVVLVAFYVKNKKTANLLMKIKLNELELKALKAQMNPHFIFNSLSNIQSTMVFEGVEKFNAQMNRFSKLLRKTLDIVNKDTIIIAEEIEYIDAYVALENLRRDPKINLTYDLDETININKKTIPVMLLQPIVENAIVHGLAAIHSEKRIKITLKKEINYITISIEDNGKGRTLNPNKNRTAEHTSYGGKILKSRLAILKKINKKEYSYTVVDLMDANNEPCGTRVIIKVPMIDIN